MSNSPYIENLEYAPDGPGNSLNWCPGNKQMVGTSLGPSRIWFTVGQGILNEVYFPRIDIPQIRDLGFIICKPGEFWVELKNLKDCELLCEAGDSATTIIHKHSEFTFTQRLVADPDRDVMLVETTLEGDDQLEVFVILAPHLGGTSSNNVGFSKRVANRNVLCAKQGPFALALAGATSTGGGDALSMQSAGYCGTSDLWQQFDRFDYPKAIYQQTGPGHIALSAKICHRACLALGFASGPNAAGTLAISALQQPFDLVWQKHKQQWAQWHSANLSPKTASTEEAFSDEIRDQLQFSAMVLKTHFDQNFRGAMVASLSVPWGNFANERPGYHLVWPRDLTECAGAFLALGAEVEAREILRYLMATQKNDGSWHQNQWLGGTPFWTNLQLDQVAFPVLLAGMLADRDALDGIFVADMARSALSFLLAMGPVSPQDRWEESSGTNPFTLSVMIAALVSGARFLEEPERQWALRFADYWNSRIEDWCAVDESSFTRTHNIDSHYVKVIPEYALEDRAAMQRPYPIKNRKEDFQLPAADQIACDFLQLVRFGLRSGDYSTIANTLGLVDESLKIDFPQGPCWYRYTNDGYGEGEGGTPYVTTGIGRPWPLLTGERGHCALSTGQSALPFITAMQQMAVGRGMLPEQLWDGSSNEQLRYAKETGSATPLAWAHAEFIKLVFSAVEGAPVDRPQPVWERYQGRKPSTDCWLWSPNAAFSTLPANTELCVYVRESANITLGGGTLPQPLNVLGLKIYELSELTQQLDKIELSLDENGCTTSYEIAIR